MGTNYYCVEVTNHCNCCSREDVARHHIGKSSWGWCFGLHVYPEEGIHDLSDWIKLFEDRNNYIVDEYKNRISLTEMIDLITKRSAEKPLKDSTGGKSLEEFLKWNDAVKGPNNLLRWAIYPNYCIGYGAGTWDLLIGDFS